MRIGGEITRWTEEQIERGTEREEMDIEGEKDPIKRDRMRGGLRGAKSDF